MVIKDHAEHKIICRATGFHAGLTQLAGRLFFFINLKQCHPFHKNDIGLALSMQKHFARHHKDLAH